MNWTDVFNFPDELGQLWLNIVSRGTVYVDMASDKSVMSVSVLWAKTSINHGHNQSTPFCVCVCPRLSLHTRENVCVYEKEINGKRVRAVEKARQ